MARLKDQKADQKRLSPGTSFGDRSLPRFRLHRGGPQVTLEGLCVEAFSLHFFNPSFGLTNLDGRLPRLPVDTVTILTLGHLARRKYN